jgi:hypothetical protein
MVAAVAAAAAIAAVTMAMAQTSKRRTAGDRTISDLPAQADGAAGAGTDIPTLAGATTGESRTTLSPAAATH